MFSLQFLIVLFGLLAVALACAPNMPKQHHGYCKFYVDGKNDFSSSRRKRDSSSGSGEGKSGGGGGAGGAGGAGGSGSGNGMKFNRSKKRKDTKCYEYEDGTKDEGAVLNKGVTYKVTVTKTTS